MTREPIYVVGYPRSGNTWISRVLGDVLNSPVEGYGNAKPIATEGQDRPGEYVIRQLHLRPVYHDVEGGLTGNELCVPKWNGGKIVFVVRDPRDIAVSIMYYWELPNIETSVIAMGEGKQPLIGVGSWPQYIQEWRNTKIVKSIVYYENFHNDPHLSVSGILYELGIKGIYTKDITAAISRQEINTKRAQVAKDGDRRPYGKEIQVKALRKGIVGDWKNHFSKEAIALAHKYFSTTMFDLGYGEIGWFMEEQ